MYRDQSTTCSDELKKAALCYLSSRVHAEGSAVSSGHSRNTWRHQSFHRCSSLNVPFVSKTWWRDVKEVSSRVLITCKRLSSSCWRSLGCKPSLLQKPRSCFVSCLSKPPWRQNKRLDTLTSWRFPANIDSSVQHLLSRSHPSSNESILETFQVLLCVFHVSPGLTQSYYFLSAKSFSQLIMHFYLFTLTLTKVVCVVLDQQFQLLIMFPFERTRALIILQLLFSLSLSYRSQVKEHVGAKCSHGRTDSFYISVYISKTFHIVSHVFIFFWTIFFDQFFDTSEVFLWRSWTEEFMFLFTCSITTQYYTANEKKISLLQSFVI